MILGLLLSFALPCAAVGPGAPAGEDPFFERWETITTAQGLPSNKVLSVLADGPRVWAGTDKGLALIEEGRVRRVWDAKDGLALPAVLSLAVQPGNGDLWVGTFAGLARLSGGRVDLFNQLNSGLANDVVYGVAADGADLWAATPGGLSRYDTRRGTWEIYDQTNTLMHEPWCYGVATDSGTVYAAVWGGGVIVRAPDGTFREHRDPDKEMEIDLLRDDGLVHDVATSVAVSSGVLWAATYFGMSRYDGRRWRSYAQKDSGLAGDFINFVRAKGPVVWIATDEGLSRFDSRVWHTWRRKPEGFELQVTGETGERRTLSTAAGPAHSQVYSVDADASGGVWAATAAGLSHGVARKGRKP